MFRRRCIAAGLILLMDAQSVPAGEAVSRDEGKPHPAAITNWNQPVSNRNGIVAGVVMTTVGLAAAGVGAAVKFGENDEPILYEGAYGPAKMHYNGVNYALMGGGAILATVGVVTLGRSRASLTTQGDATRGTRLAVSVQF